MPKLKGHKGLSKRVKITGTGKVKFTKKGRRHRNSLRLRRRSLVGKRRFGLNRPGVLSRSAARSLEKKLHVRLKGAED